MSKSKKAKISIIVLVLLVFSAFVWSEVVAQFQQNAIRNAKHAVRVARTNIAWYKTTTGRLPVTLNEIEYYVNSTNVDVRRVGLNLFRLDLHREKISSLSGNFSEHSVLNNQGGFYYNKDTGEVKLNLTEPVKSYFIICFTKTNLNEIPVDW